MSDALYLNIGCGSVKIPGFVNIDRERGADLRCDVTRGLPYADGSVDGIYSEHFIEHLRQPDIARFLRECRRVLKPGARVRIATPDLQQLVADYADEAWRRPWLQKYGYAWVSTRAEYLNTCMREWGHAWLVDEQELSRLAAMAGLEAAQRCALNESSDPHLRARETRVESTLIMEYTKRIDVAPVDPLVSLVIPAYRADFLTACLQSALDQSYANLEVVVVDDCPGDEVEAAVRPFMARDARISYRRNEHSLGEPDNLMQGIRLARGEFIKPLYDDDLLRPDALRRMVEYLREQPDVRLVVGPRVPIDESANPLPARLLGHALARADTRLAGTRVLERLLREGVNRLGEPTCMMFRRRDALEVDEPNLMSLFGRSCFGIGDICLALHLLLRGDLGFVGEPVACLRLHRKQTQQQAHTGPAARQAWLYLRVQGRRLGLDVGRSTILASKVVVRYGDRLAPLLRLRRRLLRMRG